MTQVTIAVTGHTNTGKTTLIRTLTKSNFGIVANKANVTEIAESQPYESLQAIFIDCPGFTQASNFLKYLKTLEKQKDMPPEIFENVLSIFNLEEMKYDKAAFEGIEGSDVALYVVDLEGVPEAHHAHEIEIVRLKQNNIISIINKSRASEDSKQNNNLQERIQLWESFFRTNDISHYIIFDAFWDKPSKIKEIYKFIKNFLQKENKTQKLNSFLEGLKKFNERQAKITEMAADKFAKCIIDCRKFEKNFSRVEGERQDNSTQEFIEKIANIIQEFIEEVTQIYKFSKDNPIKSISEDDLNFTEFTKASDVIKGATIGTTVGTPLGAGVGALAGAIVAFLIVGVTAGTAAPIAATIGGTMAAGGGGIIGIASMWNQNVSISLSKNRLADIAMICLACLWEISYHGYGNKSEDADKPKLEESDIKKLNNDVKEYWEKTKANINFSDATRSQISKWCVSFFEELDNGTLKRSLD